MRTNLKKNLGVFPVPIYVEPYPCGGRCIFCPSVDGIPKSYLKNEDTNNALINNFSPYGQLIDFINKKITPFAKGGDDLPLEVIILGGSFSALPRNYRDLYVNDINNALNQTFICSTGLYKVRCSILTIEARPDQITDEECKFLHQLGVSKVEIGVQHTVDKILKKNLRDHDQLNIKLATYLLKKWGFKVGYHVMIGLPHSSYSDDITMLCNTLWEKEYNPDYIKIYPCEVLKDEKLQPILHKLIRNNIWSQRDESYFLEVLEKSIAFIPDTVRISRIQRQFPFSERVNIRPGIRNRINGIFSDISSREAKFDNLFSYTGNFCELELKFRNFDGDIFFSCSHGDILIGIARVYLYNGIAMLREIKIYGIVASVGKSTYTQGRGIGTFLLNRLEYYVAKNNFYVILVNSAIGARSFFARNGYFLNERLYMEKKLSPKIEQKKRCD